MSCDRTRALVSQGLDAPLHELEQRFVAAHVRRCEACSVFQEEAEAFTSLMRSTPLEPVPWPVAVHGQARRRRARVRALAQLASAAAVVVVAGSVVLGHERPLGGSEQSFVAVRPADPVLGNETIRSLRREALARGELQILPVSGTSPSGPVKPALPVAGQ